MFEITNTGELLQFPVEIAFLPTVSATGDVSKLSLEPQKGTGFFIDHCDKYWLVTNLHNTEIETTEPVGNFDFELLSFLTPNGGVLDIQTRKKIVPEIEGIKLDIIAVEVAADEIPKQSFIVPLVPFSWGGVATGMLCEAIPNISYKFQLETHCVIVGFPGNPSLNSSGPASVFCVSGGSQLKCPHEWTHPYFDPPGGGASGAPVFELVTNNTLRLKSVHTYSYDLFVEGGFKIARRVGAGVELKLLLKAIEAQSGI